MPVPSQRKYDLLHLINLDKYSIEIKRAYTTALKEISSLTVGLSLNPKDEFYFRNYSDVNKKVNKVLSRMYESVYGSTVSGIDTEWNLGVKKNNEFAKYVFGEKVDKLPSLVKSKYFTNNNTARKAFIVRKDEGLGLSQKVWNNTRQFKKEMELALELGIGRGKSAQSLAKDVQKYLNDPNELYRRIRDKPGGKLRLSKAAKAYNPGQGRYRSSYKNAFRLTRNETNFSYERSQFEKRKQQDFIVGVEIKVSPSHNPSDDKGGVCCSCLQGRYPKDFDFTYKWHVNCICTSFNILKTRSELDQDVDKILSGKKPNTRSKNRVDKKPKAFTSYVSENKEKWSNWKSPPRSLVNN